MELFWEYALPTNEKNEAYQYESPIFVKDGTVFYISSTYGEDEKYHLHIVNIDDGTGEAKELHPRCHVIPSRFFFIDCGENFLFYAGDFYACDGKNVCRFFTSETQASVDSYVVVNDLLLFACGGFLYCYALKTLSQIWKTEISNTRRYRAGELCVFENTVACFGQDQLLFVDPQSGKIVNRLRIARIDKLFCPIRAEGERLLLGYTNWTNAGILKYDAGAQTVLWRHKRSFEGPLLRCRIARRGNLLYWVKNDTELLCLRETDGEEVYRVRTAPWLYTDLLFAEDRILFGTAGRDGCLMCIDAESGKELYAVPMKNGCAFFAVYGDFAYIGDYDRQIRQIRISDGRNTDTLQTDGEVVGDIHACEDGVFTVLWGNDRKPVRLVKVLPRETG